MKGEESILVLKKQGWKVNIPLVSTQQRGIKHEYPIKLFYTSNIPIILMTTFLSNIYYMSQILYSRFSKNFFVRILGVWQEVEMGTGRARPVGGLAYYLTPPHSVSDIVNNPLHAAFYITFMLTATGLFSYFWLQVSGKSTNDVLRQFVDGKVQIPGKTRQESMKMVLNRYIPVAAVMGGVCIGLLTIFADLLGAVGSGRNQFSSKWTHGLAGV